jgi:hypothetical protein
MDRFTFGFASYLLRLIPIGFGSAKNDRDTWGERVMSISTGV